MLHCAVHPDRPSGSPGLAEHTRTIVVIPSRFQSTRLPGKPLLEIGGVPMIVHVVERTRRARGVDRVLVATDDPRIVAAVEAHGGEAVMTRPDHRSGTDRLAEVAAGLDCDLVVNVQGDEPLIAPAMIEQAVAACAADAALPMSSLRRRIDDPAEFPNPNVVKVVVDREENALYFSRAPIPLVARRRPTTSRRRPGLQHVGLYVYRRDVLLHLASTAAHGPRAGRSAGTTARARTRHPHPRRRDHGTRSGSTRRTTLNASAASWRPDHDCPAARPRADLTQIMSTSPPVPSSTSSSPVVSSPRSARAWRLRPSAACSKATATASR